MAASNREALLDAGIACLQDKGYADTTARDVAGRANVSLGAIGYHFGSIDDLLHEALAEGVRRWFEPLITVVTVAWHHLPDEGLGKTIDGLLETFSTNRPLVVAYFEALVRAEHAAGLRGALAADFDGFRVAVTAAIEGAQRELPPSRRLDAQVAATLTMAVFDGLIIQWLLDASRLPTGEEITETLTRAAALQGSRPVTHGPARWWRPGSEA